MNSLGAKIVGRVRDLNLAASTSRRCSRASRRRASRHSTSSGPGGAYRSGSQVDGRDPRRRRAYTFTGLGWLLHRHERVDRRKFKRPSMSCRGGHDDAREVADGGADPRPARIRCMHVHRERSVWPFKDRRRVSYRGPAAAVRGVWGHRIQPIDPRRYRRLQARSRHEHRGTDP